MPSSADLSNEWRDLARLLQDVGAKNQARTLKWCAERLEEHTRAWETEALTLEQAAEQSGYSRDHLSRLLTDGVIPHAGEPYAPRIRRRHLPRKPGHFLDGKEFSLPTPVTSRIEMARSVVDST